MKQAQKLVFQRKLTDMAINCAPLLNSWARPWINTALFCAFRNDVNIPVHEFETLVSSGELIIDVREPDEVTSVRVDAKNFLNIPVKKFGELKQFLPIL